MASFRNWGTIVLLGSLLVCCNCLTDTKADSTTPTTAPSAPAITTTAVLPTITAAPDKPSAPVLVSRTTGSLTVNWTGTASFYMLQHAKLGETLMDSLSNRINVTTATATGLLAGQTYSLRVIAYNSASGGGGVAGPVANLTTTPNPTDVPTAVRSSTDNSTTATVSWTIPANTTWDNVTVSCDPSCLNQTASNTTATAIDITGLTPGETYTFITVVSSRGLESTPSRTSAPLTMIPNPTDVPTAVRSPTASSTTATVSWTNPANTTWDNVTVSCQPSCTPQTVSKPAATVEITGLTPGKRYTFITVVSSSGVNSTASGTSAPLTMTPNPTDAPTAVRSSTDSSTTANVSWTNPANTVWDDVTVSCQPSCTPQTVSKPANTVDITGLTPGETYTFITVVSSHGVESTPSRTSAPLTMTPNPTDVPNATRSSTANSTTATVSWNNPANTKWDDVTVSCQPSCTPQTVSNTTVTVDITGLTPGETYTFSTVVSSHRVESTTSRTSAPLTMTPNPTGVPTAARSSTDSSTTATVSWTNPANTTWDNVTVSCQPSCTPQTVPNTTATVDITGLTPGKTYTFSTVVSSNGVESTPSRTAAPLTMIPSDPTSFEASANGQTINLTWSYNPDHITSGFSLQCAPELDDCNSTSWKPVGDRTTRTFDLHGAQYGQNYTFTLRAKSGSVGSEVYSAGVSTSTTTNAGKPSNLQKVGENRANVTLEWDAPPDSVITHYRLYWNATDGASSGFQDTSGSTITTLTVTRLQPGFSYEFSVASVSPSSLSSPSDLVGYTAYPSEVMGLTLVSTTSTSLTFTWNFNATHEEFEYSLSPDTSGSQGDLKNSSDVYTLTFNNLIVDNEYTLKVRTKVEDAANSTSYKYSEYTTAPGRTDESIPDPVDNLRNVSSTNSSITIGWDPPVQQNGVVIGYVLQRSNGSESQCAQSVFFNCTNCERKDHDYSTTVSNLTSQCSQQDPEMSYTTPDSLSYKFLGLKVYTNYTFKVFAINTQGYSVDEILLTTDEGVPGPVRNLSITAGTNILWVNWLPPSKSNGVVKSYNVQVFKETSLVCDDNTTDTQLNITQGIWPYTNYTVSIRAKTGSPGRGTANSKTVLTPQSAPTAAPTDFKNISKTSTSIDLSWSEIPMDDRNGEIRGYILRYKLANGTMMSLTQSVTRATVSVDKGATIYMFSLTGYVVIGGIIHEGPSVNSSFISGSDAPMPRHINQTQRDSWLFSDLTTKDSITFTLTNDINELFSQTNGDIEFYQIIVVTLKNMDDEPEVGQTIHKGPDSGEAYAPWPKQAWQPARQKREVSSGKKILGAENCEGEEELKDYCNGPLRPSTTYCVLVRGWTAGGQSDSECVVKETTKADVAMIVIIVVVIIACLVIIGAVLFVLKRRGIIFRKKGEKLPPGQETPPTVGTADISLGTVTPPPKAVDQSDFVYHTDEMHRDQDFRFSQEYQKLRDMSAKHSHNAAVMGSNTSKNRWVDILPFDHSRVKLLPADEEEGSDYINANYMPGYTSRREYIATQGPLPGTIDHFWRMIWEQNVSMVVMLTQCIERGRRKCEQYWPENMEEAAMYGDLVVTKRSESILPEYTIRIFDIQMGDLTRSVKQFFVSFWPDFGCPDNTSSLLNLVRVVRSHMRPEGKGPLLIHCSAGVGRTGTYIAVDRLLQHIQDHDEIDIFNLVLEMRNYRCRMVQTEDQYIYIHDCIKEALLTNMSSRYTQSEPIYENTGQAMDPEMVLVDVHGKSTTDGVVKNTEL